MLKRLLPAILALALLTVGLPAAAQNSTNDYTDIWYLPSEMGWGVNLVQADNVIFATFFVYGPGNLPTWYTAIIYSDSNDNFSGNLYSTVGTYLGTPWDPTKYLPTAAGTASFVATSPYTGTLTYSLTGGPTVVKSIQRQTLTTIALGGNYSGTQAGQYSGNNCSLTGGYTDNFTLTVTQPGDGTASFAFTYASRLQLHAVGHAGAARTALPDTQRQLPVQQRHPPGRVQHNGERGRAPGHAARHRSELLRCVRAGRLQRNRHLRRVAAIASRVSGGAAGRIRTGRSPRPQRR